MKKIALLLILTTGFCNSAENPKCKPSFSSPKIATPQNLQPSQPNLRQQTSIFLYNDINSMPSAKTSKNKSSGAVPKSKPSPYKHTKTKTSKKK